MAPPANVCPEKIPRKKEVMDADANVCLRSDWFKYRQALTGQMHHGNCICIYIYLRLLGSTVILYLFIYLFANKKQEGCFSQAL